MASRPPDNDHQARNRWLVIQAIRFGGVAFAVLGILITQDVIDLAGESNATVGYVFLAVGLVDGFIMPTILARKWSSNER